MIKNFTCGDLEVCKQNIINKNVGKTGYIIAVLETENADIELFVDNVDNKKLDIYYFCCIRTIENDDNSWEIYDFLDCAEFDISQLESENMLKEHMYTKLVEFCNSKDLKL